MVCPQKPFPVGSQNLRARPEQTQSEDLSDASFLDKLLVLPANVRLDWKVITRYKHSSLIGIVFCNEEKKFYNIDTYCVNFVKLFFLCHLANSSSVFLSLISYNSLDQLQLFIFSKHFYLNQTYLNFKCFALPPSFDQNSRSLHLSLPGWQFNNLCKQFLF